MKKHLIGIFVLAFMLVAFGTAMAKEASFYGSARTQTLFKTESKEMAGVNDSAGKATSYSTANHSLLATSRFGAKITDEGKSGLFELNSNGDIRHLYGEVKLGGGSFLVGQTWTPASIFTFSNSMYEDNQMINYGSAISARKTQIRYSIGGFQIALIDPTQVSLSTTDTKTTTTNDTVTTITRTDTNGDGVNDASISTVAVKDTTTTTSGIRYGANLPAIELAYAAKFDPAYLKVYYGQNELKATLRDGSADEITIKASLMGALVGANLGVVDIALSYYKATNLYAYPTLQPNGAFTLTSINDVPTTTSGRKITVKDITTTGTAIVVKSKINEMAGVEVGYTMLSVDGFTGATAWAQKDEAGALYVQFPIKVASGLTITPEYGALDKKESNVKGVKQGGLTYYGFKCQLDF